MRQQPWLSRGRITCSAILARTTSPEQIDNAAPTDHGVAFEMACAALRLADRGDFANEIIARRIIEPAKQGERNPDLLCENVLKEFRERGSRTLPA